MATNSQTTDLTTAADVVAEVAQALGLTPESIDPEQDLIAQGLDS
ncbi:Non-ribosomal peptide synthetase modules-related protein, partial [Gordonia terrae C-6]